jgi:hypothetical protein
MNMRLIIQGNTTEIQNFNWSNEVSGGRCMPSAALIDLEPGPWIQSDLVLNFVFCQSATRFLVQS